MPLSARLHLCTCHVSARVLKYCPTARHNKFYFISVRRNLRRKQFKAMDFTRGKEEKKKGEERRGKKKSNTREWTHTKHEEMNATTLDLRVARRCVDFLFFFLFVCFLFRGYERFASRNVIFARFRDKELEVKIVGVEFVSFVKGN